MNSVPGVYYLVLEFAAVGLLAYASWSSEDKISWRTKLLPLQ